MARTAARALSLYAAVLYCEAEAGTCAQVTPSEFWATSPDPVSQFTAPVCGHMNADHGESTIAMIKHYAGVQVDSAKMMGVDRLGVETECLLGEESVNVRLTFPQPAEDRKSIKDRIVEMTKAAAASDK